MSHSQRLTESLLANGPFVRSDAPYSLLCVAGRDAADFLQRLCSQDVKSLSGGMTLPAAFLAVRQLHTGATGAMVCLVDYLGLLAAALAYRFRSGAWRRIELIEPKLV